MDRVGRVLDRIIQVVVLGIFLAPVVLYLLLLSFAGLFFLASALPVE